jgi:hypothetical protein
MFPIRHSGPVFPIRHSGPVFPIRHSGPVFPIRHSGPVFPIRHSGLGRVAPLAAQRSFSLALKAIPPSTPRRAYLEGHRPRCPRWNPRYQRHETFVPVGTEAGAPPIHSTRHIHLKRGPVGDCDIPLTIMERNRPRCPRWNPRYQRHETFVPEGTEAGAPPISFHVAFVPVARDDRPYA